MNLDTLTKMVQEKAGISEEQARSAVELVLNQIKDKLPAPVQGYIESMLAEGSGESSVQSSIVGGLGGRLGG